MLKRVALAHGLAVAEHTPWSGPRGPSVRNWLRALLTALGSRSVVTLKRGRTDGRAR